MSGESQTVGKPSPFDKVIVSDPNSVYGRIITRLRGYYPTKPEVDAFESAVRTIVYSTVGTMTVAGFIADRYARSRRWTRIQGVVTAAGGSMIGFWAGASVSSSYAAKKVLAMDDSFIARVVREESARGKNGLAIVLGEEGSGGAASGQGQVRKAPLSPSFGQNGDAVKAFEDYEKELDGDIVERVSVTRDHGGIKQRKYNQYGDVIEE
ncbi:hypothetical protein HDU79_009776 [Rhizoclosmatium sp. JEL0117]|nr:hypothetical protein HDU79_009776 [Rhizoclosmatium sp. JEL0117]